MATHALSSISHLIATQVVSAGVLPSLAEVESQVTLPQSHPVEVQIPHQLQVQPPPLQLQPHPPATSQ